MPSHLELATSSPDTPVQTADCEILHHNPGFHRSQGGRAGHTSRPDIFKPLIQKGSTHLKSQQHTLTPFQQLKVRQSGQVRRLRIERLGRLTKSKNSIGSCQPIQKNHEESKTKTKTHTKFIHRAEIRRAAVRSSKRQASSQYAKDLLGSESSGRGYGQDGKRRDDNLSQNLGHRKCRSEEGEVNL